MFSLVYLLKKAVYGYKWLTGRFSEQKEAQLSKCYSGQKDPLSVWKFRICQLKNAVKSQEIAFNRLDFEEKMREQVSFI